MIGARRRGLRGDATSCYRLCVSMDNSEICRSGACRSEKPTALGMAVRVALCAQGEAGPSRARDRVAAGGLPMTLDDERVMVGVAFRIVVEARSPFSSFSPRDHQHSLVAYQKETLFGYGVASRLSVSARSV